MESSVLDIRDWQIPMFVPEKKPPRKYAMEQHVIFRAEDIEFVDDGDGLEVRIPLQTIIDNIPKNRQYITTAGRFGSVDDVDRYYYPRFEKMGAKKAVEYFVGAWMESGRNGKRAMSAYIKTMDRILDFCKQYSASAVVAAIAKISPSKCNTSYLVACMKNAAKKQIGRPQLVVNNDNAGKKEALSEIEQMFEEGGSFLNENKFE